MAAVITMLVLASLATIAFIVVRVIKGGVPGVLAKTVASLFFIGLGVVAAIVSPAAEKWMLLIIFGLVFGLVGDIVLDLKVVYPESNDLYLNGGMISFGIGHILYFIAVLMIITFNLSVLLVSLAIALPLAALIMLAGKPMKLNFGKFIVHASLYAFILVFMSVYTVALCIHGDSIPLMAAGMILFLLSDLVLSPMYFGDKAHDKVFIIVNHALYYAAQICIASFIFFA